mmetsp:Transcript_24283/g.61892  ORF Transcript_24283/g.61892 Transcript_24283/m.61892 type:complete len:382 (+) Transcript_24283:62-1207(+)
MADNSMIFGPCDAHADFGTQIAGSPHIGHLDPLCERSESLSEDGEERFVLSIASEFGSGVGRSSSALPHQLHSNSDDNENYDIRLLAQLEPELAGCLAQRLHDMEYQMFEFRRRAEFLESAVSTAKGFRSPKEVDAFQGMRMHRWEIFIFACVVLIQLVTFPVPAQSVWAEISAKAWCKTDTGTTESQRHGLCNRTVTHDLVLRAISSHENEKSTKHMFSSGRNDAGGGGDALTDHSTWRSGQSAETAPHSGSCGQVLSQIDAQSMEIEAFMHRDIVGYQQMLLAMHDWVTAAREQLLPSSRRVVGMSCCLDAAGVAHRGATQTLNATLLGRHSLAVGLRKDLRSERGRVLLDGGSGDGSMSLLSRPPQAVGRNSGGKPTI